MQLNKVRTYSITCWFKITSAGICTLLKKYICIGLKKFATMIFVTLQKLKTLWATKQKLNLVKSEAQ